MRLTALSRVELAVGLLASAGSVAFVSALIEVLRPYMPVLSLGVLYVFAVLAVAVFWGIELAVIVSVASMLAFNWFFFPPTHTFQLRDGANWAVLAVYLVTAVVVSALAAQARRRAEIAERREREASVLASMAGDLLAGTELAEELERVGVLTAGVLGVPHARIALGVEPSEERETAYPLAVAGRRVGTVLVGSEHPLDPEAAERFLPGLASLLAVEVERAGLEAEVLEAEALRRSDTIKTALLRAVSHDLRSPLTAIVAAASGLANPEVRLDRADRDVLVETIRAEAARLNRLVGNLLDMSRLQSGVAAPHPELWPVDGLVSRALEQLGPDEARVATDIDPDAPAVRVDPVQIERVLVNLLENALKFSPPESTVRVRTETTGSELLVHVLDLGEGVAPGLREAVFEPFRRGDEAAVRGAGLGLAIARGFAEVNGARVWAEGDETGGHFVLALPVADRAPVAA
jgi:two-component system, OmpR family, sensor histidine kinase KdpD